MIDDNRAITRRAAAHAALRVRAQQREAAVKAWDQALAEYFRLMWIGDPDDTALGWLYSAHRRLASDIREIG